TGGGCGPRTAAFSPAIAAPRLAPAGRGLVTGLASGDWPECSSQSGPRVCCAGVGHTAFAAADICRVAQSADAASRPVKNCQWASQKWPACMEGAPQYPSITAANTMTSAPEL